MANSKYNIDDPELLDTMREIIHKINREDEMIKEEKVKENKIINDRFRQSSREDSWQLYVNFIYQLWVGYFIAVIALAFYFGIESYFFDRYIVLGEYIPGIVLMTGLYLFVTVMSFFFLVDFY